LRIGSSTDDSEINITSMSDSGGVKTVMSTTGQVKSDVEVPSSMKQVPAVSESLESMAMMGQSPSPSVQIATTGPQCRGCSAPVSATERFCPHCGLDL
ncbi:MAG: hypothetical protein ACPG9E_05565, partial [Poseidonia sp.]